MVYGWGTFCYELYLENGIVVGVQGGCGLFCGVGLGGWLGTGGVAFAYQGTDWVWLEHLSFVLLNNVTIIMYIYIYIWIETVLLSKSGVYYHSDILSRLNSLLSIL